MPTDVLNRYLFDDLHARGELVQLDQSFKQIIENHNYPQPVSKLLGELMAATSLLTATLKFEGEIAVQIQGDGPVKYAVINGNHQQQMRGIAKVDGTIEGDSLQQMLGKANMVITVIPNKGERYQGIVALQGDSLAESLEHYFATSEQLATKIWLYADTDAVTAGGAFVQVLPDSEDKDQQMQDFEHISQLTATLKAEEVFSLPAEEILYRLYHEETVRMFEPQQVSFVCGCSEDKCLTAIANIGRDGIEEHLQEHGEININCDFCLREYRFDREKLKQVLNPN
ncbi:Hsp33 family molecular chaperone HslO [Thalassotalea sp. HSM 43]|uniref:Hsp33 family molecular chaperone HslO n=1 Tax=Thalassotalea sp. HSM 43 TaxID=2552945 RepID=UPI00108013B7|nr:Hsp33 family molecular chaperone HslO [Thalassotalea sp. HSM 43]QBY06181.1 Hsp33 family molecular chaperone HslO [Thalassotalea sp. HSM 43]